MKVEQSMISKAIVYCFKIFLLLIGIADFINVLPPSLDILDKGLAALILFLFWLELKPIQFLLGKKSKSLDILILVIFYTYMIETFVTVIRTIDLQDPIVNMLLSPIFALPTIKNMFMFVYNPAYASSISLFSTYVGFLALFCFAFWFAKYKHIGKDSVAHSVTLLFGKEKNWDRIVNEKTFKFGALRFLLVTVVLFAMVNYFFQLVNQWFLVSLDKSLFFLAILFVVKDFKNTKSDLLNTLGNFDELILRKITKIFTTPNQFYLGFSILLLAHYLSDLSTFFMPYFLPFLEIESYYVQYLSTSFAHDGLFTLFAQEGLQGSAYVYGLISYILSGLGVLFLIVIPIIMLYLALSRFQLETLFSNKYFKIGLALVFVTTQIFLLAPWVDQLPLVESGVQGVDFITQQLSLSGISFFMLCLLALVFICITLFLRYNLLVHVITAYIYLLSLFFFGNFVWNYFYSSLLYHSSIIQYFWGSSHVLLYLTFAFLLLLEGAFYLGGFLLFVYHITTFIAKPLFTRLFNNTLVVLLSIVLLLFPIIKFIEATLKSFIEGTIIIIVLSVFCYSLYSIFKKGEFRDDYLLGVILTIASFQLLSVLGLVLQSKSLVAAGIFNMFHPIALGIIALFLLKFFKVHLFLKIKKRFWFAIPLGLVFGGWFYLIDEASPLLFSNHWSLLLLYAVAVAVAEEYLFRGMFFTVAERAFSYGKALVLQALVFTCVHFVNLIGIYNHYGQHWGLVSLYFVSLFMFGLVAGLLIKKQNILPAIIFHIITNVVVVLSIL